MSNTAPVENEQSAEASQHTSAAISSTFTKRPIGILESMYLMCVSVIWSKIAVFAAAGVTQFTSTPDCASSLPSDLVSEMTPPLDAEYATALGLPSLPATEAMLTMRPYPALPMCGATARQQRNWLGRLMASPTAHSPTGECTGRAFRPATA